MSEEYQKYSITQMSVRILSKYYISQDNFSLRIALSSHRRKYLPRNSKFWGNVYSNVMEVQKHLITIDYIEGELLSGKNYQKVKPFLDLLCYWTLWNRKSSKKIEEEITSFDFSSNKEKRIVQRFHQNVQQTKLRSIIKQISEPDLRWSIKYSLPLFLFNKIRNFYDKQEIEELGTYFNEVSPKYFWLNPSRSNFEETIKTIEKQLQISKHSSVPNSFMIGKGRPLQQLGAFNQGKIIIQDIGATITTDLVPQITGGKIIDLCASPGNKTVQLLAKLNKTDPFEFYALDIPGSRFETLKKRTQFLLGIEPNEVIHNEDKYSFPFKNGTVHLFSGNGTNLRIDDGFFDLVFIDAPCTGSGTLGTKPDTRLQLTEEFILKHTVIQTELLQEAYRIVKPGGFIFYATCSILVEENEQQIINFTQTYPDSYLIDLQHELGSKNKILPESIRLYPPKSNSEGFFMALIQKPKSSSSDK